LNEVFFPLSDRSRQELDARRAELPGDFTGVSLLPKLAPDDLEDLVAAANVPNVAMPSDLRKALQRIGEEHANRDAGSTPATGASGSVLHSKRKGKR
jgi:hypothetical protein